LRYFNKYEEVSFCQISSEILFEALLKGKNYFINWNNQEIYSDI